MKIKYLIKHDSEEGWAAILNNVMLGGLEPIGSVL